MDKALNGPWVNLRCTENSLKQRPISVLRDAVKGYSFIKKSGHKAFDCTKNTNKCEIGNEESSGGKHITLFGGSKSQRESFGKNIWDSRLSGMIKILTYIQTP